MEPINGKIQSPVENVRVVDTHEHIMPESERDEYAVDFGYLFGHYNTSDLVSSGMPLRLLQGVRLPMYKSILSRVPVGVTIALHLRR